MSKLRLTFACGPYDRTLALRDGSVQPEGIELNYIASQPPDIFWRMLQFNEFEISEMSLSNYATLVSTGKAPFVASRHFRRGSSATATSSSTPKRGSRRRPTSRASAGASPNTP
jgi:4,5-dihydroxyphthalate decarboxylase